MTHTLEITVELNLWIENINLDNVVWDSEIIQTTAIGTANGEPTQLITTVGLPEEPVTHHETMRLSESYHGVDYR